MTYLYYLKRGNKFRHQAVRTLRRRSFVPSFTIALHHPNWAKPKPNLVLPFALSQHRSQKRSFILSQHRFQKHRSTTTNNN
jgi:hypothetical protein